MRKPLKEVAKELADAHRKSDPRTRIIKLFPSPKGRNREIRLLEVSDSVPKTREILPFRFEADPAHGVDYPSVVILLHPEEWRSAQRRRGGPPKGWPEGWGWLDSARDL